MRVRRDVPSAINVCCTAKEGASLRARLAPVRDKAKKRWLYAGHVGTGFDRAALKSLYGMMQPLRTDKKHLDQKVKDENATTGWLTLAVGSPLAPSRHARQRRRWASAIRSRPACVFGPVDNPPWKRQRALSAFYPYQTSAACAAHRAAPRPMLALGPPSGSV